MPVRLLICLVVVLSFVPGLAAADLAGDVRAAVAKVRPHMDVAVHVREVTPGRPARELVAIDADRPMIPASNMKLVTTAAALDGFGDDFAFRTLLAVREQGGQVEVAVVGDADPTFGDGELLRRHGTALTGVLDQWAELLRSRGIKRIDALVVDDSVLDGQSLHPRWEADDLHRPYAAEVGGLNFNANCLDVYVDRRGAGRRVAYRLEPPTGYATIDNSCVGGSQNAVILTRRLGTNVVDLAGQTDARVEQGPLRVTIAKPTAYFAAVARERFEAAGVDVAGSPMLDPGVRRQIFENRGGWRVLAVHETPIDVVVARTNKDSENLYAEALFKRLGFAATGEPGSWQSGAAAVAAYLDTLGAGDDYALDDGSGLSRDNRLTARLLTAVLADQFADRPQAWADSLSVAGVDGTLSRRFASPARKPLRRRVRGKSGYIRGVSTLSGLVQSGDRWFAFSVLCNDIGGGKYYAAKDLQERVVELIDKHAD